MNYWIKDHRANLLEMLKQVNALLINDTEAKMLAGQLARLATDLGDDLWRQAMGRDDASRVAGMNAGLLDMFHDTDDEGVLAVA